eukprot:5373664-Pleurochrysis_carterae.AAC.1
MRLSSSPVANACAPEFVVAQLKEIYIAHREQSSHKALLAAVIMLISILIPGGPSSTRHAQIAGAAWTQNCANTCNDVKAHEAAARTWNTEVGLSFSKYSLVRSFDSLALAQFS